ncbi:hypothetical protein D3C80_1958410 [compost metagenome]
MAAAPADDLLAVTNSYFGLLGQATHSHRDRSTLANVVLKRGRQVNGTLTQTYR